VNGERLITAATGGRAKKMTMRLKVALSVLLALASIEAIRAARALPTVSPAQVADWQEKGEVFLFVDTRAPAVFELKHARGAMNLPAFAFASKPLPRAAKIVLYDNGAGSPEAEKAAELLQSKGHPQFFILEGGLTAWEAENLPIVVKPGVAIAPLVDPIGSDELMKLIDTGGRVFVLDLRPADLYKQSRVPGAMQASTDALLDKAVATLAETDLIVLYDDGGGEGRDRAETLRRRGFRAVKYLYGGMIAWREKKMRVER